MTSAARRLSKKGVKNEGKGKEGARGGVTRLHRPVERNKPLMCPRVYAYIRLIRGRAMRIRTAIAAFSLAHLAIRYVRISAPSFLVHSSFAARASRV